MSEREEVFDEAAVDALGTLFEQFWILREEEPETYRKIRDREQKLKRYIQEKFGLELTVHQHFIKLEKIPVKPENWMGIQSFQEQMDYAIFCCALAYTEQKAIDEQFLLSDLAERIQELYPGEFPLDWTHYQHRRSLVRALKEVLSFKLIKTIDGNLDAFQMSEDEEVLYEVSVHSRYFMRSYPDDLVQFSSMEDLLEQEWKRQPDDQRRKRVYRKLMMMPIVHRKGEDDPDFAYIRNFRNRLRDDFEQHTPFRLEVFKNAAMLTIPDMKKKYTLFPDTKGITDAALHTMAVLRDHQQELNISETGRVRMPAAAFEAYVRSTKEHYGHGWGKKHRDETPEEAAREIIKLWLDWNMAEWDEESQMLTIFPGAARLIGFYPADYIRKKEGTGNGR
ncbi:TIGR02678 family protein [Cytobacillus sp. NCCP-133]|uniref:TIGR02678 family protein n=1 Tax=Cytobacillus sp. NCCP-133 TaxID=766848 RepID=UPI0022312468|nr:TIGR02678 family protein [Cytobacillus sp. NCCP-133]GLB61453.1 TIGR02678 family protein [Cytobacillus sp. NCCP-133]